MCKSFQFKQQEDKTVRVCITATDKTDVILFCYCLLLKCFHMQNNCLNFSDY